MKIVFIILFVVMSTFAQYDEPHRPQLHFSPPANWMNDPNGMVYHNGEYHLFYQYYPNDIVWGPMHWGHAVSRDLIHWKHLPIALEPDKLGYIFSGSAVVDKQNSSGFGTKNKPPLVAMFTYHLMEGEKAGRKNFQYQGIAYSTDNGRTWTKYDKNPVIPNTENLKDFRDTKVFWHEESKRWIVVLAAGDHIRLYSSSNLKTWKVESEFGKMHGSHAGVWECPDLFPLKINGKTKWVLLLSINPGGPSGGSATQYFIGDFDGKTFKNDNPSKKTLWLDYGRDNYAGVTWSNVPGGRRAFLGWMSNWDYAQKVPTSPWRSAMTLPRELSLKQTSDGIRVNQKLVKEIEILRVSEMLAAKDMIVTGSLEISKAKPSQIEMIFEVDLSKTDSKDFGIEVSNKKGETFTVGYNVGSRSFYTDRRKAGKTTFSEEFAKDMHTAPRVSRNSKLRLHLIFDNSSVELFADDGEIAMTDIFFPTEDFTGSRFFSTGGKTRISNAKAWNLRSIWH